MTLLAHEEGLVIPVDDSGIRENILEGFEVGDPVSSPLYTVIGEHMAALLVLVLMPLIGRGLVRFLRYRAARGSGRAQAWLDGYAELPTNRRWAVWAVITSAIVHVTLVFTHELSVYTLLYGVGAVLLALMAIWIVQERRARLTVLLLVASVIAFWFLGAPPDQVGVATKLAEMFALALLVVPGMSPRRRGGPAGVVTLVVVTGIALWIGAFANAGDDGGHHGGEYPDPGTVVPYVDRLEATTAEQQAADDLYSRLRVAVARYEDPAVARADGYQIGTIVGTDYHADNPAYLVDGRTFDPERPETLVYGMGSEGPVLVGAMFQTEGLHAKGPAIGGPLTLWHSHENICFSLTPPALISLMSPYGMCPVGSFNIPITNEMIHAWTLDGVEDEWGHIDDEWLDHYLFHP